MRLPLEIMESDCLKLVYNDKIYGEESCELVIPDTYGDVEKILDVRAQVLVTGKKSAENSLCIYVNAEVNLLFLAEDGVSLHNITAKLPFELTAPTNGIGENCFIVADATLSRVDARMLNPRKLLIRAEVCATASCYKSSNFVLWEEGELDKDLGIHLQKKYIEHSLTVGIIEKNFTLSDEYTMPKDGGDASNLISCNTKLCVGEIKTVGNKVIFKATAETDAVFLSADNDVYSTAFVTQFSQLIELDKLPEESIVDIIPYLTATDFVLLPERDECVIAANFKICVQAVCTVQCRSAYIADAYSCCYPLELLTEKVPVALLAPCKRQRLRLESCFEDADCESVLYASCTAIRMEIDGCKISFSADVRGVGRRDCGDFVPLSAMLKGFDDVVFAENQHFNVSGVCVASLTVAQNKDICLELCYDLCSHVHCEIMAGCALEFDETCPCDVNCRPSLTVICANNGEDLWAVAKKHNSDVDAIISANSVFGEFSESMRPLIVPKV